MFSGGCFFNRILSALIAERVGRAGLLVVRPRALSCGDAGLALGQAWVASWSVARGETTPVGDAPSFAEG